MERRWARILIPVLAAPWLAPPGSGAHASNGSGAAAMNDTTRSKDGARDFDFWMGSWRVHNRRLRERLKGSTEWEEFEATVVARPILGGVANEDEYRTDHAGGFIGMSFRFFDPATRQWSIYWADSRRGVLDPPVVGGFTGDTGLFEGRDVFEGRPILVRFSWSRVTTKAPHWEQAFSDDGGKTWETNWIMDMTRPDVRAAGSASADHLGHLEDFPVIELRRYTVKEGEREHFARYFESYFPEAFEQLGALILGQFLERGNDSTFTWIRGFKDLDARATVNGAFYGGPLWKEHAATMNDRLIDHTNVLLLHPLRAEHGITVLPAVDAVREEGGARGVVVAQVFAVKADRVGAFAEAAEPTFARYRSAGVREAGLLVTLDVPNNFPRLPFRTDGPYLVWLGILADDQALETGFRPLALRSLPSLTATGLLREPPELLVLDPTRRSRLRWLPDPTWNPPAAPRPASIRLR
jgi:hypothetical protein